MRCAEISERVGSTTEVGRFPDALVSLNLLLATVTALGALHEQIDTGAIPGAKQSPAYLGGILEMVNDRLYGFGETSPALGTGLPQKRVQGRERRLFSA
jgi:hypothetical protein